MRNQITSPVRVLGRRKAALPNSRTLLLKTARNAFLCKGLLGATVDEIAKDAGLSTTMIYYHFSSKEGLACALANLACNEFLNDFSVMWDAGEISPPSDMVFQRMASLLRHHLDHKSILNCFFRDPGLEYFCELIEVLNHASEDIKKSLHDVFAEAQRSGVLNPNLNWDAICHRTLSQSFAKPSPRAFSKTRCKNNDHAGGITTENDLTICSKEIIEKQETI